MCLESFDCVLNILDFTVLDVGFCCIPLNSVGPFLGGLQSGCLKSV